MKVSKYIQKTPISLIAEAPLLVAWALKRGLMRRSAIDPLNRYDADLLYAAAHDRNIQPWREVTRKNITFDY